MTKANLKSQQEKLAKMLPLITGVLAVTLVALAYVLLFMPKLGRFMKGGALDKAPYLAVYNSEAEYQTKLRAHLAGSDGAGEAERRKIASMVPVGMDVPGLIVALEAIADRHNMLLVSVDASPAGTNFSGGREGVRLAMTFTGGSYETVKALLGSLESSARLLDIGSVIYSPSAGSVSLSMTAYYLDPARFGMSEAAALTQ